MKEDIYMEHRTTLIAVKDIEKAKVFYKSVLGLDVVMDVGANVELTKGISLQTADSWASFICKQESEIVFSNNAIELYFETDDIDNFIEKLKSFADIEYLHPLIEHSWGQRAVRFYVTDHHIIEVAENIAMVTKKFIDSGLTIEQTAKRMDVGIDYIKAILER